MSLKEDIPFLKDMLESPEESSKLVWCYWLEDRGDPRAEILRTNRCGDEMCAWVCNGGSIQQNEVPLIVKVAAKYILNGLKWPLIKESNKR